MKKFTSLIMAVALTFSMAACGQKQDNGSTTNAVVTTEAVQTTAASTEASTSTPETQAPETSAPTSATEAPTTAMTAYPLTLTDQTGRTVVIQEEPKKLVSGYYISTSALIALGVKDRLVGIEAKANKRNIYKLSAPELIDLPNVGTAKEFDMEGCVALQPDLVVLPAKLKNAAATLEELGITVLLVNPETQAQLDEMITLLAKAINVPEAGDKLLLSSKTTQAILAAKLAFSTSVPSVYMASSSALLSTAGSAMYQSDLITGAGGKNVAADITDTYWVDISYEQLLAWNPEYIIIAAEATYDVEDVLNDANLAACTAVINKNVYKMPVKAEAWDSPVPSGILGTVWLASVLHNDCVTAADRDTLIDSFYEEFYGFKYSIQ